MALGAGRLAEAVDTVLADAVIERPAAEEVAGQAHRREADGRRPEYGVAVETGPARPEGAADGSHRAGAGGRAAHAGSAFADLARPTPGGSAAGDRPAALPGHQGGDHLTRLAVRQLANPARRGEGQGVTAGAVPLHLDGRKAFLIGVGAMTVGTG